ncbi:Y-family DNA polymerase [Agrobacterium bohemicum]|nr:DNA polymerase Y family protein [Agrobacterium bohemicum]
MARVVSLYFPRWPTDRIRRAGADGTPPPDKPMVVISRSGSRRTVCAADDAARKLGLRIGMPASKAQALVADLAMYDADPVGDLAALDKMALWMLRQYSPVVAVDGTDGIVIDTEGADHLQGGEELMVSGMVNRLRGVGVVTRAAVADTWGAAHAIARCTSAEWTVVPVSETTKAVLGLPIVCLRLAPETVNSLRVLGIETVGQLSAMPRAPLTLRFGPEVGRRLDQLFGRAAEPIEPIRSPEIVEVHRPFAEPIGAAETIAKYVGRLVGQLCSELETRGLGVRRCDLIVHRVDNTIQAIRAGLAKPVRDDKRLTRLLTDRIEKIDPGFGIEKLSLVATWAEPLVERQQSSSLIEETVVDVTPLVDILGNRGHRIYRMTPVAGDVPERSFQRIGPMSEEKGVDWPSNWPRPSRLLARPEEIEVLAVLPDSPPRTMTWRGKRRRIVRGDGPERVFGEWWLRDAEFHAVRDYYVVEDDSGERFWVYRAGDGVDTTTGSHRWFIHGIFG